MKFALHIFRRDLRLIDNTALNFALTNADEVFPCFIFDTRQVGSNSYKSSRAVEFMMSALADLEQNLLQRGGRLIFFEGIAEQVISKLVATTKIDLVTFNRDYTPFALARDSKIEDVCRANNVSVHTFGDALLQEPESVHKDDGSAYTIFTPYFKKSQNLTVRKPEKLAHGVFADRTLDGEISKKLGEIEGRKQALKLLKGVGKLKEYAKLRDLPAANYTTHLSAHNKFGTLSIRELYHEICSTLSKDHMLISELYWRDFFTHIVFHFPHVMGGAFHKKYDAIAWKKDLKGFKAWCEGKTGFPIVDAGMHELNETGYMHNRVRMITASFLVKDLHIDWRLGERYFAQQLIDYDPAVNNGNWQWAASTGCDAQPYFRVFNPQSQLERFDPDCEYVDKWCVDKTLRPIVDHKQAVAEVKSMYKQL